MRQVECPHCHHRAATIGAPTFCPSCAASGHGRFEMLLVPTFLRERPGSTRAARPFRLIEVGSRSECLEILIEGELDSRSTAEFRDALDRALDSDHLSLLVDLDRCEFIDVAAVKLLVVAQEHLSCRRQELVLFGATGQVRHMLEAVEAFGPRALLQAADEVPEVHRDKGPSSRPRPGTSASWEVGDINAFGL